jgi:hypothetical protein
MGNSRIGKLGCRYFDIWQNYQKRTVRQAQKTEAGLAFLFVLPAGSPSLFFNHRKSWWI